MPLYLHSLRPLPASSFFHRATFFFKNKVLLMHSKSFLCCHIIVTLLIKICSFPLNNISILLRIDGVHFVLCPCSSLVRKHRSWCLIGLSLRWPKYLKGSQNNRVINFTTLYLTVLEGKCYFLNREHMNIVLRSLTEHQKARGTPASYPRQMYDLEKNTPTGWTSRAL